MTFQNAHSALQSEPRNARNACFEERNGAPTSENENACGNKNRSDNDYRNKRWNGSDSMHDTAADLQTHTIDTASGQFAPASVSEERVKCIFSNIARKYGLFNTCSSFGTYRLWLKALVDYAPITHADAVLDIAGGTGDVSFCVARKKKPASIVCSDLVPEMLAVAKERYQQHYSTLTPIDFQVVDAQHMPFDDASFDCVTVAYGIRNMPDRKRALQEIRRVLKPGGACVCLEFSHPHNKLWRALYEFYLRHNIPLWGKFITGDRDGFVYLAQSIHAFPGQKEFAQLFEESGFKDVTWKNCAGGIAAIHRAFKPREEA